MNDTDQSEDGGLLARIKESPRTVSALIIILIVAAAIYAFSGDENGQIIEPNDGEPIAAITPAMDELGEGEEAMEEDGSPAATPPVGTATPSVAPASPQPTPDATVAMPEARQTKSAYVEVAQAGEGVTHLGRRAADRWLSANQADYTVTKEHRIYIEDYIKDRLGSQALTLGAEQTISFELVAEAVTAAGNLTESELSNLSQYTHALP